MLAAADREVLQAARLRATRDLPYLATALHALQPRAAPGLGTFAVDGSWRLWVDPQVLDTWTVPQVAGVLVHEVWHLLRGHAGRLPSGTSPRAWNTACDAEINDDLVGTVELPGRPVVPALLGMPEGLLAEQYLAALRRRVVHAADCGSAVDGQPRPYEQDSDPGLLPVEGDLVRAQTARAVQEAAGTRPGAVPGGWQRWARQELRPVIDWRTVLASTVRAGVGWAAGASDFTRSRPSRRAGSAPGVVLPALRRPVPPVVIVVDTSASVEDAMLGQALAEVDGALRAAGVRRGAVTVLTCDAKAGPAQRVRAAAQLRLAGGGGTDLGAALAEVESLRPGPRLVVVLTDGFTPWPARPPRGTRVVVGLLDPAGPPGPSWARTVAAHPPA